MMLDDPVYSPVWADVAWSKEREVEKFVHDFPRWYPWLMETCVVVDERTGCHEWTGPRTLDGYGVVRGLRFMRAHRLRYLVEIGPIAYGLVIDHLCENHPCCNPDHLDPVTEEENLRRAGMPWMKTSREKLPSWFKKLTPLRRTEADRRIAEAISTMDTAALKTAAVSKKSPYRELARAIIELR